MIALRNAGFGIVAVVLTAFVAGLLANSSALWQPAAVALSVSVALLLRALPSLRTYQYTAWIVAAVTAAMIYPGAFLRWGEFDLRNRWVILVVIQTVMFGMGTQMSLKDFLGVMRMPWGVIVAVGCQFLIMPLTGFALTRLFPLPDEIAAGVILIGCCSSGLASNVMCFIARANLALSITATAIATLLAPLMTPLWMKLLAGQLVEVRFIVMMSDIIKIVLVPIAAAMLHDFLKHASSAAHRRWTLVAGLGGGWLGFLALGGWSRMTSGMGPMAQLALELGSFGVGAVVFGVVYHVMASRRPALDRLMPLLSMVGIVYFTTITTAAGRDNLLQVGVLLFVAAILHNTAGYVFGYGLARAARLDQSSARAVAIEVGLQNGGMASGLAGAMGKLGTVGLAAAVFSPWMNVSGSLLANFWRRRPVGEGADER